MLLELWSVGLNAHYHFSKGSDLLEPIVPSSYLDSEHSNGNGGQSKG